MSPKRAAAGDEADRDPEAGEPDRHAGDGGDETGSTPRLERKAQRPEADQHPGRATPGRDTLDDTVERDERGAFVEPEGVGVEPGPRPVRDDSGTTARDPAAQPRHGEGQRQATEPRAEKLGTPSEGGEGRNEQRSQGHEQCAESTARIEPPAGTLGP